MARLEETVSAAAIGRAAPACRVEGCLPLEEYGALGDGRTVALSGSDGSIDWLCVPNLDTLPLFDRPLDPDEAGASRWRIRFARCQPGKAPDRIVPIGLAVRAVMAAYAGGALAPRDKRALGAAVAVAAALASSYIGWRMRCAAMRRFGQTATGFVEDAIVFGSGLAIANPKLLAAKV